jgi:RNA polymerase subunit RPABC4/transcription elongation factor Spt4
MFRSRRPEKGRKGRFWDWLNPALGKEVNAWLVGLMVGVETHWLGRTQPCRRYITGGLMKCYCQTSKLASEWKGYVPLLDENEVQCFAIIGSRYEEQANKINLFKPVVVTRLKRAGSPVMVKESAWTDREAPTANGKQVALDIRPWLLKLWKDEELTNWFAAHPENSDDAAAPRLNPEDFSPMLRGAARKANRDNAVSMAGTLDQLRKELPHLNGKAKK